MRATLWGLALLVAATILAACASREWHVVQVTQLESQVLAVDIASCNATYEVDVDETPQEVRVTLAQLTPTDPPGSECADEQTVPLDDPLGDRTVFVNGNRFDVTR